MNNSKIFVFIIALLLVVAILIELSVPKQFDWEPTFSHKSEQPFGSQLFDSLAKMSMKNGYSVSNTTFYQLRKLGSKKPQSVITLSADYYEGVSSTEMNSMLAFVADGNKVLFCTHGFSSEILDTLELNMDEGNFYFGMFKKSGLYGLLYDMDTLVWDKDFLYKKQVYNVFSELTNSSFKLGNDTIYSEKYDETNIDSIALAEDQETEVYTIGCDTLVRKTSEEWKPIAWKLEEGNKRPVVMKRKWGKGEIVVCSTPLLFTNYGIMDGKNVSFVYRVLNTVSDNPVTRLTNLGDDDPTESNVSLSPMRFFITNPPLRWAMYMALLTLLLFMIFTARRRQRVIPVIKKPENYQLEFAKLIGTLYYQEGIHGDLVRKKYLFFTEFLRREIQIDIDEDAEDEDNFNTLSRHTGMPLSDVSARIKTVRRACRSDMSMTEEEMIMYVDYMNDIVSSI